ncbi:hypothetical protein GUJ93_ZPchr0013g34613 [Zizania palustris]|uniref:NAB domain-containing protein n=1 Tax=Zizania palustris TaxID=103762 RepID=A0A8J5WWY0_ZIZPA|nr:hypothetical protein GUJ93_ZPchr0013g34613 [Zizania palustris]
MMEATSPTNTRRKYSWWWNSHICPKNSKWLQENLTDMDSKIKLMIKIIDEDAESFAQRAEMYYRRRPELMTLLEELYRAYRALAERYDHAAGELRLAHRKIVEVFPDQVLMDLDDDLPAETASVETDMDNPDITSYFLSLINASDSKKHSKDNQDNEGLQKELASLSQENQDLKSRISSMLEQTNQAKSEIVCLKEALAKQEADKEAAVLQCQQSTAILQNLKCEILRTQEKFNRLKEDMQTGLQPSTTAHEQSILLERENQEMRLELNKVKHLLKQQHEELNEKQAELEKLNIYTEEEHLKCMQAEMAQLSLEKQLVLAQDKLRLLALEKQIEVTKAKDIETKKVMLEKELEKIIEENTRLNDQSHSSSAVIIRLQDEIILMKNAQRRFEEDISRHVDEKKTLHNELCHLKDDRSDLEKKHFSITEQIQNVDLNVELLQALVQELKDGNVELKGIIRNHESNEVLHIENLRQLERMSEKNAYLEESLLAATTELEVLREKKTMSELLEKNAFMENSLSDTSAELESLRGKLKEMGEFSEASHSQNSVLQFEKSTLACQIDRISDALLNSEAHYTELQRRHSDLQQEKDAVLDEVIKLQEQIRLERKEHYDLGLSRESRFAALQKQINKLLEEGRNTQEQLEEEQQNIVKAQIDIFIWKKCLEDMAESNSNLSAQLQMEREVRQVLAKKMEHLSSNDQKLTEWISSALKVLQLEDKYESLDQMKLDSIVHLILHEINCLLNTVADAQDEKQYELVERSLVITLLEHFGQEVADLRSERNILKQEQEVNREELLQLQRERKELVSISDEFWKEMENRNRKVDELRSEAKFLIGQLSELQESRRSLQSEIIKLIHENSLLSNELYDSREKNKGFEDDFSTLVSQVVSKDILAVVFRSLHEERTLQLESLHSDFAQLQAAGSELYQGIKMMNKKLGDFGIESNHCNEELSRTISVCNWSSAENATGRRHPAQRGTDILNSGRRNQEYHVNLETDHIEVDMVSLEKSNEILQEEVHKLQSEVELLRSKESTMIGVTSCDEDVKKLLTNMQMAIMNAALFKEKVLELIITCESFEISNMVQKEVLKEDITRRNSYVDELKDKLNAVEIENRRLEVDLDGDFIVLGSLQNDVSALEKQTLSLANDCLQSNKLRMKGNALSTQILETTMRSTGDENAVRTVKDMELQKLHGTIKALQQVVMDTGVLLEQERLDFNDNLQEARKQIEVLKLREILDDNLIEMNYEQMLKDIPLDLTQTSSVQKTGSLGEANKTVVNQGDNKMLDFHGIVGASSSHMHNDLRSPQSKSFEIGNSRRPPSELMAVKELSIIDKQELPSSVTMEPHQEWKNKVIERLSSDAHRLNALQSSIQDLRRNTEASEELELESVRYQIMEAEGTIMQLIDSNSKLSKKAEEFTSTDGLDGDNIDLRSRHQRKLLERARKMSEKTGRLEVEMHKVQEALLKYQEEQTSMRASKAMHQRRSKVRIVDFLYGRRRDSRGQRGSPCGCMRAKAIDD